MALVVTISACGTDKSLGESDDGPKLKVVATVYPLFDVAVAVGGKHVAAHHLRPLAAFSSEPLDQFSKQKIGEADLVLGIDEGVQNPVDDELRVHANKPVMWTLDYVSRLAPANGATGEFDPHFWLDPEKLSAVAVQLAAKLSEVDPAHASSYARNLKGYTHRLTGVDQDFRRTLRTCEKRQLVTTVGGFRYVADAYGIDLVQLDPSLEQTPDKLADEVKMRAPEAHQFFTTSLPPIDVARRFMARDDLRVAVLGSLENQTDQIRRAGGDYATEMGLNLDAIRSGLVCNRGSGGK